MRLPSPERLKRGRAAVISCERSDCNICVTACGFTAVSRGEDGVPFSDPEKCVGCGGCAAICPQMAIRLVKERPDGTFEVTVPHVGELPELDESIPIRPLSGGEETPCRVIQAIPKRPKAYSALVRVIAEII